MSTGSILRQLESLTQQDQYWCDITGMNVTLTRELHQIIRGFLIGVFVLLGDVTPTGDLTTCLFLCYRSVQLTCIPSHDLLLPVLVRSDGSLPLTSLSVTGCKRCVSFSVRERVSQYAPAVVAAASSASASSMGASRVPSLFCGPISDGPVPGSSVADIPVRSQSSFPGEATGVSPVSTEPAIASHLPLRKSTGSVPGKKTSKVLVGVT